MIQYTKEYISQLLDRFMEGTSTLEEEDILSQYFTQNDIPADWEQYRLLFAELESMKPSVKPKHRWIGWSIAVAVVVGILYVTIPSRQIDLPQTEPLVAQVDTTTTQQTNNTPIELTTDTTLQYKEQAEPIPSKKRSIRKPKPTLYDYDKAGILMAQAEQERQEAERQIEQARMEIIEAQLAAYGYIPVKQEDGTIIYINEQTEYIAYEE
jgi:hypothetical protein